MQRTSQTTSFSTPITSSLEAVPPRQTVQAATSIPYHPSFSSPSWVASLLARPETSIQKLLPAKSLSSRSTSMTLSSTSRQQRKSMLPKPRPSSRIGATRRVTSGDTTSRIARRVPSPMLAIPYNSNSVTAQAAVRAPTDCNLPLAEAGLRRAGSPSRIQRSAAGQIPTSFDSCPTPTDRSEESSSVTSRTPSPSPEAKKRAGVNVQYPTPPTSAEVKHERFFKGHEGRGQGRVAVPVPAARYQFQDTPVVVAGGAAPPARRPPRRPASVSTALTLTNAFSRVDNAPYLDGGIPALKTWKKSALMSSNFSGKENRRPRMYARVPPPPVVSLPTILPRSIRKPVVVQPLSHAASFRETPPPPRPLVIRKQLPLAAVGSSPDRSASGDSVPGSVPTDIRVLIGDIDRFAKEWTEMFDELSASAKDPKDRFSKSDASIRICPTGQPVPLRVDNPAAGARKGTFRQLQPGSSGSTASVSILHASTLAGTNAETDQFGVTPAILTRCQHRDKSLVKNTLEDRPERDLPVVVSASATDLQTDRAYQLLQKAVLRNGSLQTTPQASRQLPSLLEINQSSTISVSHPVDTTSVVLSNRKDEATNLPQTTSTTPRGIDTSTARRNGILQQARCYSSAKAPRVSASPLSNVACLSDESSTYSSSPLVNLRANDFSTSDAAVPTRSSSLRGLRAIFKRTSTGLTGSHRQRAESLKDRISEPRVLSLGSISISNLRDAGVVSGCALPTAQEEGTTNAEDSTRITAVQYGT